MAPETWEKMSSVRLGPGNTEGEHSSLTLGFPTAGAWGRGKAQGKDKSQWSRSHFCALESHVFLILYFEIEIHMRLQEIIQSDHIYPSVASPK